MADHWRTPHGHGRRWVAALCGAIVGPAIALAFVLIVIELARLLG